MHSATHVDRAHGAHKLRLLALDHVRKHGAPIMGKQVHLVGFCNAVDHMNQCISHCREVESPLVFSPESIVVGQ